MTKISATVVADSINEFSNRITSMLLVMPRIILAEFNTHRMFSRNSASSRAIPFAKTLQVVKDDPFIPIKWMKDHPGMQGNEYYAEDERFDGPQTALVIPYMREKWLWLRSLAVQEAEGLNNAGYHFIDEKGEQSPTFTKEGGTGLTKQMCNRLLEPWMWTTVLCTATEWENFFALRAHEAAEIHMQELAYRMLDAMNASKPKELAAGEWHIPFGDDIDDDRVHTLMSAEEVHKSETLWDVVQSYFIKIATARAARTSYTLVGTEAKHDYAKDIELHDRLLASGHLSPFEHCAQAMTERDHDKWICGNAKQRGWCHNFRGFIQYRTMLKDENKHDSRLLKK